MLVDFSQVNLKEPPLLILKNVDGTPIQPLGYARNAKAQLRYNDTSVLTFELPEYVDGKKTPHYDDVVGLKNIDWSPIGMFVLVNPVEHNDGIQRYKECTAYSLEYEFTYKTISIETGTYNFWNPMLRDNTVIGRILERMPSWSVGEIDDALWNRYRTFDETGSNIYNFIKSTLQQKYSCIFEFDTYERKINVRSASSIVSTRPVYISLDNLAKEIETEENTEDILTCLDVNGADSVDIRSVNPLGTNKIYNLSYYLTPNNVGDSLSAKWANWQKAFSDAQADYFRLTVDAALAQARYETAAAKLTDLKGDLTVLENLRATYAAAVAQGSGLQSELDTANANIRAKEREITSQENLLLDIKSDVDLVLSNMASKNASLAFPKWFSASDLLIIDRYTKEDSLQDSSFVVPEVETFSVADSSGAITGGSLSVNGSKITMVSHASSKESYSCLGGALSISTGGGTLTANMIRGVVEYGSSGKSFIFTAYLADGSYNTNDFDNGCISISGTCSGISHDLSWDTDTGAYQQGSRLSTSLPSAYFYLTKNNSEFEQTSVEWDLYDYATEILAKKSAPTYTFSVSVCNFFALDAFEAFKNAIQLGQKLYLDLGSGVLEPICIGASLDFEKLDDMELEFGDKYSCLDNTFTLADLLDQSISMGKSADFSKFIYEQWVSSGASNSVAEFIKSALDVAKNNILSSSGQAISWGPSGMYFRKWNASQTAYLDEQIAVINNSIVFTDDSWASAKMAIGKFSDGNAGDVWGIVAPAIVGTLLAGNSLVIESSKKSNGVAVFRVDGNGAKLYNADFDIVSKYTSNGTTYTGQIGLHPTIGITAGHTSGENAYFFYNSSGDITGVRTNLGYSRRNISDLSSNEYPLANFWADMYGNVYLKGNVYATDGVFTGTIHALDGDFTGTLKATTLEGTLIGKNGGAIKGVSLGIGGSNYDNFVVDSNGNVSMRGNINLSGGYITWGSNDPTDKLEVKTQDDVLNVLGDHFDYITSTKIGPTEIESPTITGNNINVYGAFHTYDIYGGHTGYIGSAYGSNAEGNTTQGVAMYSGGSSGHAGDYYVIVTNAGVRLQAGGNCITVTGNTINLTAPHVYVNGTEIGV